jgi:biotin carboxylase
MSRKKILFVAGYGGPPLDYSLPRVGAHGRLYVFVPDSLPTPKAELVRRHADVVLPARVASEAEMEDAIVEIVRGEGIDGIVTLDEFSVAPVARAAMRTGLRGAGPSVTNARNKWLMRNAFRAAGLTNPEFRRVTSLDELRAHLASIPLPALLKLADGAGSLGHTIFERADEAEAKWAELGELVERVCRERTLGATDSISPEFILESMIPATTESWYDEPGFGDLVSVEGMVVRGRYHPIAVTSKLPMVPPFTEVAQITPSVLPRERQEEIIAYARRAVDALGLDTCGTHTELKLQADGGLCMVESAARLPGAMITRQVEDAFGVDLTGLLTQALLDQDVEIPEPQFTQRRFAAGPLGLVTMNSRAEPWRRYPRVNTAVDFTPCLDPGVTYEVRWSGHIRHGEPFPRYDARIGAMNYAAVFYFLAPDLPTLIRTQRTLMDQAEGIFSACEPS